MFALFTRKPAAAKTSLETIKAEAIVLADKVHDVREKLMAKREVAAALREEACAMWRIKAENRTPRPERMTLETYREWNTRVMQMIQRLADEEFLSNGGYYSWQVEAGIPPLDAELKSLENEVDALMKQAGVPA